ncbi:MAG: serine/threonine-protein kinase, partial [bacterium]|nr:serine/threonine-protein kinase [bacterium]
MGEKMLTDRLFEGKYKILEILGSGGMSTVYLAQNVKLGTLWAIKEINKKSNPKIDLFIEPNILKKLNHPALPRIFDIVEDEENIYVIVDFIEGVALDKEIKRVGAFEEERVINWAKQLCEVLNYLHAFKPNPIIYRDMKPSNIILTKNGAVKLIDFGIAREYKTDCGNDTVYIGTRGYAAPEQYGNSQTNVTTDIYSLGVTLAHLLSGISPNEVSFENKAVDYCKKNTSNCFEKIISKCMQLSPFERYQSIQELLCDIQIYENSKIYQVPKLNESNNINYSKNASFNKAVSFKRLVLTVWGNGEFASEFAYFASILTDYNVLIINLDFLTNGIVYHMNLKGDKKRSIYEYGFNEVINEAQKDKLSREMIMSASIKRAELENLYILMSDFDINNYELYKDKNIEKLITAAYKSFELT